jgi:hypothetical protein
LVFGDIFKDNCGEIGQECPFILNNVIFAHLFFEKTSKEEN